MAYSMEMEWKRPSKADQGDHIRKMYIEGFETMNKDIFNKIPDGIDVESNQDITRVAFLGPNYALTGYEGVIEQRKNNGSVALICGSIRSMELIEDMGIKFEVRNDGGGTIDMQIRHKAVKK